MCPFLVVGL